MIASETAAETMIAKKKLKIKFGTQRIEAVPGTRSLEDWRYSTSVVNGSNQLEMRKSHGSSDSKMIFASEYSNERSSMTMPAVKKREAPEVIEGPKEKRRKMDRGITHQCSALLKSLMTHPAAWVFKTPVDPIKLNIPDYFSIISKPMDLGTVKSKLNKNIYSEAKEFVADVRLTFSNAMHYNPPENDVHQMAVELNGFFDSKWKFLEEKWIHEKPKVGSGKILSGRMMEVNDTRENCPRTPPLLNASLSKKSKKSEENVVKSSCYARAVEVKLPKPTQSCTRKLVVKNLPKGTSDGGRRTCVIVNVKPPVSPVACKKCSKCGSSSCQCNLPSDSIHASSSDITSERSLCGDHRACSADASNPDCQAKSTLTSQMSKSDPDSDGAVSALDDGNICPSSHLTPPAIDSASTEGWNTPLLDVQMSPKKALRAAMLKSRFADTILKAQHRTLLDHSDKIDPVKMQQEKERLEKRQREEKLRIEAQLKAAEAASRIKAEKELKKQREREREAARIALHKMERTVEIEQNLEIMKELESLTGCCLSPHLVKGGGQVSPLERIGLFMKRDYMLVEDEEIFNLNGDGEEGEIF